MTKQERQDRSAAKQAIQRELDARAAQTAQNKLDRVNDRIVKIQERLDKATAAGNDDKIVKRTAMLEKFVARKAELES